jgi:hypothetical protein
MARRRRIKSCSETYAPVPTSVPNQSQIHIGSMPVILQQQETVSILNKSKSIAWPNETRTIRNVINPKYFQIKFMSIYQILSAVLDGPL